MQQTSYVLTTASTPTGIKTLPMNETNIARIHRTDVNVPVSCALLARIRVEVFARRLVFLRRLHLRTQCWYRSGQSAVVTSNTRPTTKQQKCYCAVALLSHNGNQPCLQLPSADALSFRSNELCLHLILAIAAIYFATTLITRKQTTTARN